MFSFLSNGEGIGGNMPLISGMGPFVDMFLFNKLDSLVWYDKTSTL